MLPPDMFPVEGGEPVVQDPMNLPVSVGIPAQPEAPPPPPANPLESLRLAYESTLKRAPEALAQAPGAIGRALAPVTDGVSAAGRAVEQYGGPEVNRQALEKDNLRHLQSAADLSTQADRDQVSYDRQAAIAKQGQLEQHQRDLAAVEGERQKVVGAQISKVRQISDEARNTKIDPNRLFKNAGTSETLGMFLSVGIGGLLAPNYGGKNGALDLIERRVERDIDAQKADLDNLNRAVTNERSILGDLREQFGDQLAAEKALHGIALDQVANTLEINLAGVKDLKAQARGQEMVAQIRGQALEYHNQAEARVAAATQQQFENKMKKAELAERVATRQQQVKENEKDRAADLAKELLRLKPPDANSAEARESAAKAAKAEAEAAGTLRWFEGVKGGTGADGHGIPVMNAQDGDNISGQVRGAQQTLDNLADAMTIVEREGRTLPVVDEDKRIAEAAMANAISFMAKDEKGVPSDADIERIKRRAGGMDDPTKIIAGLTSEQRVKVLKYVADRVHATANDAVKERTGGKGRFEYTGRSLISQKYEEKERTPDLQVDAARKASTKEGVAPGDRAGEFHPTLSPAGEQYSAIMKTKNFKSIDEAIGVANKLNENIRTTLKAVQAAKTPEDRAAAERLHIQALMARDGVGREIELMRDREKVNQLSRLGKGDEASKRPRSVLLKP